MTIPKIETISKGGSRLYRVPMPDGGTRDLPGVTSVISMMDKPALPRWAAIEVAKAAAEHKARIPHLDDAEIIDLLKGAPWRSSNRAAGTGTDVHAVVEGLLLGRKVTEIDADLVHPVKGFLTLRREFKPRAVEVEVTGINLEHGFAGTLDGLVEINGALWLSDVKTSKAVYADYALQMAAYRHFEFLIEPDGTRRPMPPVVGALVMHLPKETDKEAALVPIASGPEEFEAFLSLLTVWQWKSDRSKTVVGKPLRELADVIPY